MKKMKNAVVAVLVVILCIAASVCALELFKRLPRKAIGTDSEALGEEYSSQDSSGDASKNDGSPYNDTEADKGDKGGSSNEPEKSKDKSAGVFGNVVCNDGKIYYWQYSNRSFYDEDATFGHYSLNGSVSNKLVCRSTNGDEKVIAVKNGFGNICIAEGRIYYQIITSEGQSLFFNYQNCKIYSCDLNGNDVKEICVGVLLGITDGGKYLIVENVNYDDHCIFSIDTKTEKRTVISEDNFLVCSDFGVVCYSENIPESRLYEEDTVYTVSGDGRYVNVLHTEKAATLPSIIEEMSYSSELLNEYITFGFPMIVNNKLFYIYEHIAGTGHVIQSARIMQVDINTGEAKKISNDVNDESGLHNRIDLDTADADVLVYRNYLFDPDHLNVLRKSDYSDFCGTDVSEYGDESDLLSVVYYEHTADKEYVFLTYGKFTGYNGWRSMFRYNKCALFERDTATEKCKMIYSSENS